MQIFKIISVIVGALIVSEMIFTPEHIREKRKYWLVALVSYLLLVAIFSVSGNWLISLAESESLNSYLVRFMTTEIDPAFFAFFVFIASLIIFGVMRLIVRWVKPRYEDD